MKTREIKILYITGNGHSGSTLLDIVLGSAPGFFSAGEVSSVTRPTIHEEYCSCGKQIGECPFWKEVWQLWKDRSTLSGQEYRTLRLRYERSITSFITLKNRFWPGRKFLGYCEATRILFEAIQEVSGAEVIIDSSKSPTRIAVLRRFSELSVIHLIRNFTGVLNSAKSSSKKDIKAGIEEDNPARSTIKTWASWFLTHLQCEIFCIGIKSNKLRYREYLNDPEKLEKLDPAFAGILDRAPFTSEHMLAGNKIRLKKSLKVDKDLGFKYTRLNHKNLLIAKITERLFWFWN